MTQNSKNIKAQVTTVHIGNLKIEGLMNESGDFGIAVPQICALFDIDQNQATRTLKRLVGEGFSIDRWKTPFRKNYTNVVNLKTFELTVAKLDRAGNKKAQNFRDMMVGLSLQQLFCDAFCIKFEQSDRQEWLKQRLVVKRSFKNSLTDALQRYGYIEPWQYGKFVHAMQEALGIKDGSRDELSVEELVLLESAQRYIGMAVDEFNLNPYDALKRYVAIM